MALRIAAKDLTIEFRTRTAFFSALLFALLGITIFYFAWDPTAVTTTDLAPGVLWVIFTFSGLLGLHRSFGVEMADHAIDGILASPVSREAVFLGKANANLVFVIAVQLIAIPALVIFYNLSLAGGASPVLAIAILAAIGLVAVGTLFSAMAVNTRLGELLPLGGADHDWSAIELAAWLARSLATPLRLVGTEADEARGRRDASRLLARASLLVQQVVGIVTEPVCMPRVAAE